MPDRYGCNTIREIAENRRIESILTPDAVIFENSDPCTCGLAKLAHFPAHGHAHNCPVHLEWSRHHEAAIEAVKGSP